MFKIHSRPSGEAEVHAAGEGKQYGALSDPP